MGKLIRFRCGEIFIEYLVESVQQTALYSGVTSSQCWYREGDFEQLTY